MTTIAFTGGRNFRDESAVRQLFDWLQVAYPDATIHHGDASGLDELVGTEAYRRGYKKKCFLLDWDAFGKIDWPSRNREMLAGADFLVSFPGGKVTADCVKQAKERKIPVIPALGARYGWQ